MTAALRAPTAEPVLEFGCGRCGATLSVPARLGGVKGACPCCGESVESPRPAAEAPPDAEEIPEREPFAASRVIPRLPVGDDGRERAPGRTGWRMHAQRGWRVRRAQFREWFLQRQALLSVMALAVAGSAVLFFASMGWKLPWQLSEDSLVVRIIDRLTGGTDADGSGGAVPTTPRRR